MDTKDVTTSDGGVTRATTTFGGSYGYRGAQIEILAATSNTSAFFAMF